MTCPVQCCISDMCTPIHSKNFAEIGYSFPSDHDPAMLALAELQMKYDFLYYVEPVFDLYVGAMTKHYIAIFVAGLEIVNTLS